MKTDPKTESIEVIKKISDESAIPFDEELLDEELRINKSETYIEKLVNNWSELTITQRVSYIFISTVAIGMSLFHLYTSIRGTLPAWQHRSLHLGLGLMLAFALNPFLKKKNFKFYDFIPLIGAIVLVVFVLIDYPGPEIRQGVPSQIDIIMGTLTILLVFEATRRTSGLPMVIIALIFLIYIFTGPLFPGLLGHQGFRYSRMINQMFNGTEGIFGSTLYVSSTVLFLYVLWGSFLMKSGGGQFFTDISLALTGHRTGGPAIAAVISSALVGSITGNGAANVAITGSFTIPLMKKIGYKPAFAGAVEAVASQGGQIMPPVMGAAAFIMAEYLAIPYIKVAQYALIPALGYFLLAALIVYLQARKMNLGGIPKDQIPDFKKTLVRGFYFFLPIVFIVVMMARGSSPMKAGFWATILTIGLSYIRKETRLSFLDILSCLEKGARSAISVIMACAIAGIIVGSISMTGLGIRFSKFAVEMSGGNVYILLVLIMFASLILGMGMPTTSAYIILAVLATPPLIDLGINPVAAHLFVFYFGVISGLTPPVAITAYAAAGIAGSDPSKTGLLSTKIGIGGFILPFMFVLNPELVMQSPDLLTTIQVIITSLIGCASFAIGIQGYFQTETKILERIGFLIAAFLFIESSLFTDIIALVVFLSVALMNIKRSKQLLTI